MSHVAVCQFGSMTFFAKNIAKKYSGLQCIGFLWMKNKNSNLNSLYAARFLVLSTSINFLAYIIYIIIYNILYSLYEILILYNKMCILWDDFTNVPKSRSPWLEAFTVLLLWQRRGIIMQSCHVTITYHRITLCHNMSYNHKTIIWYILHMLHITNLVPIYFKISCDLFPPLPDISTSADLSTPTGWVDSKTLKIFFSEILHF